MNLDERIRPEQNATGSRKVAGDVTRVKTRIVASHASVAITWRYVTRIMPAPTGAVSRLASSSRNLAASTIALDENKRGRSWSIAMHDKKHEREPFSGRLYRALPSRWPQIEEMKRIRIVVTSHNGGIVPDRHSSMIGAHSKIMERRPSAVLSVLTPHLRSRATHTRPTRSRVACKDCAKFHEPPGAADRDVSRAALSSVWGHRTHPSSNILVGYDVVGSSRNVLHLLSLVPF